MHKVRKILVPIDFSEESGRALRDAVAIGRETGAQVVALNVIDENAERNILLSDIAPVDGRLFFWTTTRGFRSTSCCASELSIYGTSLRNTPDGCTKRESAKWLEWAN